jgi:cytochrome c oxidase subunit 4
MSSEPETQHKEGRHPTFKQYVFIAIVLFAITAVEFVIIVPKSLQGAPVVLAPLILLSAVKFAIVIMYYMHLRFDHKLLSIVFLTGLVLAFGVGAGLLTLFTSFTPEPRAYAKVHAVPFTHGAEGHVASMESDHSTDSVKEALTTNTEVESVQSGTGMDALSGQALFTGQSGCSGCHTIEGVPGAIGQLGPELTHIGTVASTRIGGLGAREYIEESINNPTAYLVDGYAPLMPAGLADQMTDEEFASLVDFLVSKK